MRILITGGGGYLGTVLVRQLLTTTAHHLTILDRFSWGAQPLLSVLRPEDAARVQIIRGDVRDYRAVQEARDGAAVVVHLAGIVGYPACDADPQDADSTNVVGTQLVCMKGPRVIFASTGSCYGKVEGEATEATALSPLTRYGRNKVEGERIVLDEGGTILRFATLFGLSPRMRWDLLPNDFCLRALQGPLTLYEADARRTFLHVEDAAEAIVWALDGRLSVHAVWNVGHASMNWSKRDLAHAVQGLTHCEIGEQDGQDQDKRDYAVNYDRIGSTGYTPQVSLHTTLGQLVTAARVWA
jgi:nucleoside-diphosphate-sugar epimerase